LYVANNGAVYNMNSETIIYRKTKENNILNTVEIISLFRCKTIKHIIYLNSTITKFIGELNFYLCFTEWMLDYARAYLNSTTEYEKTMTK
jgi:hypothetical protein